MAGWTKEKIWAWERQEDRKRAEYNRLMAERREQKRNERDTIAMLLDAVWDNDYDVFVKITRTTHKFSVASYWETFYNEVGEEVPRPKGYQSA